MKVAAGIAAAGVVLALPVAAADAKSHKKPIKTVFMGLPSAKTAKQFQALPADVNDFFPHGITIHVGDKVRFVQTGFHTLDFPRRGAGPIALIAPNGTTVSGVNDAAGAPFWFNGQPNVGFNPALLKSRFGKVFNYRGAKRIESGLPLAPKNKPITIKFTKRGNWTFFCDIHPGMKGVVHVRSHKRRIPSLKSDRRAVRNEVKRDFNLAKAAKATKPNGALVDVGVAGPHGVEYYGFAPGTVNVHVGDTLRFQMSPGTFETHTVTTGQGNPLTEPNSELGQLSASFNSPVIDPRAVYPSEQPPNIANLTPTLHGDGFWNSGALDRTNASPLPSQGAVKFGAAGTYQFYCLIHPFMHLTVVAG